MDNRYRISGLLSIAFLAASLTAEVWAQQPEEKFDLPEPDSPAVLAVLETNPSTPAECARAAKILSDFGRPDLGKQFLQRVIDAKPSQEQLAGLVDQFGSAMFTEMAARDELLPEARQLADVLLAAANRQFQKRIPEWIAKLQDPSPEVRYQALEGLKKARAAAVGPMVAVLADANRAAEHDHVRAALVRMPREALGPLLGLLEKSDPRLMAQAIRTLAQMDAKQAAIFLLGPYTSEMSDPEIRAAAGAALRRLVGHLPTKRQAIRLLTTHAKAYFDGSQAVRTDADGRVRLWSWDAGKKQCIWRKYSAQDAALANAARLARDAYALAKDDPEIRLLYLTTMLEAAAYETGLDKPLPAGQGTAVDEVSGFGVEVIEDVMQYAIGGGHVAAAAAAARILGQKGKTEELLLQGAQPAPLVLATRQPDRRLRLAATNAVLRLRPSKPFPGSSYIPESLAFFAASGGVRRALVAGPNTETCSQLAGRLAGMGFEVDTATTGRELIRLAGASPDYEVALIDAAIQRPTADMLLQQLRRDCRTARLRVGLIARSGYLERARRIARHHPLVLAFSRPHTDEAFGWQMERLASLAPRTFVAHPERQRQAAEALDCLAEISGPDNKLYDVRRIRDSILAALYAPELSTRAAAVLGNLNSAESQRALVDLASRWTQPLEVRTAAVAAFRRNTEAHGILLTTDEIERQYDRYNNSEESDVKTQQVLGLILDCIEAPTQPVKAKGEGRQGKAEGGKEKLPITKEL